MIFKKLYGAPITDDILLREQARQLLDKHHTVLSKQQLRNIQAQHGIELATAMLYESILKSEHHTFINKINNYPATPIKPSKDIKLLLVPGLFYKEAPEVGADGEIIARIASSSGFKVEKLNLHSKGNLKKNHNLILNAIKNEKHPNVWIFALSKATAEVKQIFDKHLINKPTNIKGWVNISGIWNGTHLANHMLSNLAKRAYRKSLYSITGVSYKALQELQTHHIRWLKNKKPPESLDIINIFALSLLSVVHPTLIKQYKVLSKYGPNDGVVAFDDISKIYGKIYPIWGSDHYMHNLKFSALTYKLLHYIDNSTM